MASVYSPLVNVASIWLLEHLLVSLPTFCGGKVPLYRASIASPESSLGQRIHGYMLKWYSEMGPATFGHHSGTQGHIQLVAIACSGHTLVTTAPSQVSFLS